MVTKQEFIQKIKEKYPEQNNIDDETIYNDMLKKHPVYKSQIIEEQVTKLKGQEAPKEI